MFIRKLILFFVLFWLGACSQTSGTARQTETIHFLELTAMNITSETPQTQSATPLQDTPRAHPSPLKPAARLVAGTARPISTELDQTPVSTAEGKTPTIGATRRPAPPIPWVIYARSFTGGYITIDLSDSGGQLYEPLSIEQATKGPGWCALDVAFSNYSDRVAYVTSRCEQDKGQPMQLWISDLRQAEIKKLWSDTSFWLGKELEMSSAFYDYSIVWGKNDRYLLLSSHRENTDRHMLVYDIPMGKAVKFVGDCEGLVRNQNTQTIDPLCTDTGSENPKYFVLEDRGIIEYPAPPGQPIRARAWRFSSDGERVLFVREDNRYEIIGKDDESLALALEFSDNPNYRNHGSLNMQWVQDNSRVLVYGEETNSQHCPKIRDWMISEGEFYEQPCWFVLDAASGDFLWWPDETMAAAVDTPLEYLKYSSNMAISPDGKWLATTIADSRIGHVFYFVISSLESGISWEVPVDPSDLPLHYLIWREKF